MKQKYNVLMISVDQLGRNHMEIGGDKVSMMPTVRYFADHGLQFDNCYSECPVCIPARRSLMTGMSPKSHGDRIYNDTLPMPSATTLAQAFRNGGYQAYSVGKLHVYPQRNRIGFDDSWITEEGRYEFGETDDYQNWLSVNGFAGEEFMHGMGNNVYYTRPWHLPEYAHPTNWVTRKMCEMIKRLDADRPAFLYASYQFPHPPLVPLKSYLDMYDGITLPLTLKGEWSDNDGVIGELREAAAQYTENEKILARKAYYAQCAHIDHQIRILIGTLRECNRMDHTLVVFFSDHGDMLFDHGMVAKRVFYESAANIPMILFGKPVAEFTGVVDHRLCALQDVMPTLLSVCGLDIPDTVEGMSLLSDRKREYLYGEVGEGRKATRMIRGVENKLIYYPNGNVMQLFDMEKDREETHNLIDDPQHWNAGQELETHLKENLYGKDLSWITDGILKGEYFPPKPGLSGADYGLYNQRGYHVPAPKGYTNLGKNA